MSDDLISREKLKKHYAWWAKGSEEYQAFKKIFDTIVNLQPTVDAVDVVKCENCKYYCETERMCNDTNGFDRYWKPTDFCSYGIRKTKGD